MLARLSPRVLLAALAALGALYGCANAAFHESLDPSEVATIEQEYTYTYTLAYGKEDPVCRHMLKVYAKQFRKPWDFRESTEISALERLRILDGQVAVKQQQPIWIMRYATWPTSPEYSAIDWVEAKRVTDRGNVYPLRIATIDLGNSGKPSQIYHVRFFGAGNDYGAFDSLIVMPPEALDISKPTFSDAELFHGGIHQLKLSGQIIRLFSLNDQVYLSEYASNVGEIDTLEGRHLEPEKLWVRRYSGDLDKLERTDVCEFDMRRTIERSQHQ